MEEFSDFGRSLALFYGKELLALSLPRKFEHGIDFRFRKFLLDFFLEVDELELDLLVDVSRSVQGTTGVGNIVPISQAPLQRKCFLLCPLGSVASLRSSRWRRDSLWRE